MTARAMEELTDAIVRDYVRMWYGPLLPDDERFPNSVRNVLANVILAMYNRISSKRGADTFLMFLMSASNTIIVFLRELASAQGSIEMYLENSPTSAMAQLLDRDLQKRKLRMAADDVLQSFFGKDVLQCDPVRVFLTEILAGVVLETTVDMCSKPDWINNWIVYLLDKETRPEILQKVDLSEATGAVKGRTLVEEAPKETMLTDEATDNANRLSRAEAEMAKALEEAREMNRMIDEEESRKHQSTEYPSSSRSTEATPDASTNSSSSNLLSTINSIPEEAQAFSPPRTPEPEPYSLPQPPPPVSPGPTPGPTPAPAPAPRPAPRRIPSFSSFRRDSSFVSFDQITENTPRENPLYRAHVSLEDLTPPPVNNPYSLTSDSKTLRSKPAAEYLLKVEPPNNIVPGWLVVRKYTDFENLHEVLKRIAAISGNDTFRRHHIDIPTWRNESMASLRLNLEGYLNDALHDRALADSEGMKRFLEKDTADRPKGGFNIPGVKGWPNPAAFAKMGQGALDVLSKAPQGVADGSKGLFGGMKKAFTVGQRQSMQPTPTRSLLKEEEEEPAPLRRQSTEPFSEMVLEFGRAPSRPASRPGSIFNGNKGRNRSTSRSRASSILDRDRSEKRPESVASSMTIQLDGDAETINLPPPPCDMPDDYDPFDTSYAASPQTTTPPPISFTPPPDPSSAPPVSESVPKKSSSPLTLSETTLIIEIVFSVLSELYTLSSAWTLRRSLLNIAKSLLLRPGNATLENLRVVLQETVIEANTTDEAVAAMINKLREGVFPTEQEKAKLAEKGESIQGAELREKARKLLLAKGVPEALRGVMGAQATEEALERVWVALQECEVARGVVGGVLLEGVRGGCH
ncbi:PXA domain-containing protein [Pyronema omphalodes]|nr:PXA domain-containing protein [Pyronema omphalodes]